MQEFSNLLKQLNQIINQEYLAVNAGINPIVQILPDASSAQLICIMQQYSFLTKEYIVTLMQAALEKALEAEKFEVAQELQENLAEELGEDTTQGVPHYTLLAKGLEESLSASFIDPEPSPATSKLLENLKSIFRQKAPYVLGATYAIEVTSVPDMRIALRVIESLFENKIPNQLQNFFANHLSEWEPEHEEDLRRILTNNLDINELAEFEAGFRDYVAVMNRWWKELKAEVSFCTAV